MKTPIRLDYVPGARGGPLQEHVLRHLRDMQHLGFKRATLHYDRLLLDDLAGCPAPISLTKVRQLE